MVRRDFLLLKFLVEQEDFVSSVLNSGVLVILTPEFLAEIYQVCNDISVGRVFC